MLQRAGQLVRRENTSGIWSIRSNNPSRESGISCVFPAHPSGGSGSVAQYETFSPANQDFLMQLRTLCDSVLHTYLSKIADTAEKRNYLHVLYTAAADVAFRPIDILEGVPDLYAIPQILELSPPMFRPCRNPRVLFDEKCINYLRDFLRDPERSKLFYYDPGLCSAVVVIRYMRYLRTTMLR